MSAGVAKPSAPAIFNVPVVASAPLQSQELAGLIAIQKQAVAGNVKTGHSQVAAGCAALVTAAAVARSVRRQKTVGGRRGKTVRCARGGEEEEWKPRNCPFSNADLADIRSKVGAMDGAEAAYNGPHYESPKSIDAEFVKSLLIMQKDGNLLPKKYAFLMVLDIIEILGKETTMPIKTMAEGGRLTVIGDLHGQLFDFQTILDLAGLPSATNQLIFNGDFVDRGSWSIEVILLVFALKLMSPDAVGLNRGNHEMLEANIIYGFAGECGTKYDLDLFDLFSEAFRRLPLAHLVDKKVLVLHAGLPGPNPRIWMPGQTHDPTDAIPLTPPPSLDQIAAIDRDFEVGPEDYKNAIGPSTTNKELIDKRFLVDLVWSDPRGSKGWGPSYRKSQGIYTFGPDVTQAFIEKNNLQCILRSHEVKQEGYAWDHGNLLCTVFSAPNYLDTGNNKGSIMRLSPGADGKIQFEVQQFEALPHPDLPPMHWQSFIADNHPYLLRKMRKKVVEFDEWGDSDFAGMSLMNFDEWEPDEAEAFQDAFKLDEFGRELGNLDAYDEST
jgi:hypothetical protein